MTDYNQKQIKEKQTLYKTYISFLILSFKVQTAKANRRDRFHFNMISQLSKTIYAGLSVSAPGIISLSGVIIATFKLSSIKEIFL